MAVFVAVPRSRFYWRSVGVAVMPVVMTVGVRVRDSEVPMSVRVSSGEQHSQGDRNEQSCNDLDEEYLLAKEHPGCSKSEKGRRRKEHL